MSAPVDVRQVKHRVLRFESIDECLAEIERIADADAQGTLRTTGNWTSGQNLAHLAAWIEYGYDGYPVAPPPFFIRWFIRLQLRSMLQGTMPRGIRIPRVTGGTTGADDMPTRAAAERLVAAFDRLAAGEPARFDSPAFGPMSHDDRILLNLRHAELHLGYLVY